MGKFRITPNSDEKIRIPITYFSSTDAKASSELETIIDTGGFNSYLGVNALARIGRNITVKDIKTTKLVDMTGITGKEQGYPRKWPNPDERIYAAFAINLTGIKFDESIIISSPTIYIPLSFRIPEKGRYIVRFERQNIALIGMDILRKFNFGVNIDKSPIFTLSQTTKHIPPRLREPVKVKFHD